MKKLLALLSFIFLGPVMAQEIVPGPYYQPPPPPSETGNIIYTTLNPPPQGAQYNWTGFIINNTNGGGLQGGNIPAYNTQTGTFIWGYMQGTVTYNFFGNTTWPTSGIQVDGFKYSWEYFNQDFSRGSLSANISIFGTNNTLLGNYNFAMPQTTEGWTIQSGQIDFIDPYDRSEITRLQLSFTGKDDRFWAGYWGPQVRDIDVSIMYSTPSPPPPTFLYWNFVAGEWGTFTLSETTTVRYGAQGTYLYATLQPGTYECTNGAWGNDPIGGVVKSCEVGTNVEALNCEIDPSNPQCVINAFTDPEDIADNLIDELVADINDDSDGTNDTFTEEEETFFVSEDDEEETVTEDNIEEFLTDNPTDEEVTEDVSEDEKTTLVAEGAGISAIEFALAVAGAFDSNSSTSTTSTTRTTAVESETTNNATTTSAGEETLETGRLLGASALAATLSLSEASSIESLEQAESIALIINESISSSEVYNDAMSLTIDPVLELVGNINQVIGTGPNNQSDSQNVFGLTDEELVTINNDPSLAAAFNVAPNTTTLEMLGILKPVEEKSDAEKRSEEVVAANAKEQEEINNNYMEADQSGIVAAIGSGTDFTSYRSAMLTDNIIWYRPEDIYKNVVYRDNARGMYFLEKGNTDTYKKMVEEQYK